MKTLLIIMILMLIAGVSNCQTTINPVLDFTVTGDDGMVGLASHFDLRYSTDSLILINDWDSANQVHGEPDPEPPGTLQEFNVIIDSVMSNTTYYFAMKVGDEVINWSTISNIAEIVIPDIIIVDITSPGPIMNLRIRILNE